MPSKTDYKVRFADDEPKGHSSPHFKYPAHTVSASASPVGTRVFAPSVSPVSLPPDVGHIRSSPPFSVNDDPRRVLQMLPPGSRMATATEPGLFVLTVTCKYLPNISIRVTPSSPKPGASITIGDLVVGINDFLQQRVDDRYYNSLPPESRFCADRSKLIREQQGDPVRYLKLVDFLGLKVKFMGLKPTAQHGVWALELAQ
ncbi:hypothetical protein FISHEDRAFT_60088 [Fistulina hepatica ATCC 64428]|uniref:DUF6699 domain-containing protein n=1 Tax=Fistulina hepatica ATCC 64428 TaxID=1128425 RepID=A0A0D7A8P7_9AGAR|nr:hypothetical protein FISHEDRAFT_60088 [Fistulina hepatica ATCC 64428]